MSPFATLLERYRERAGIGINALARASHVDPSYVSKLASGDRHDPTAAVVVALARSLALDARDRDRLLIVAGHAPDWMQQLARTSRITPRWKHYD